MNVSDVLKFDYPNNLENSRDFYFEITYNTSEFIRFIQITTQDQMPEINSRHLMLDIQDGVVLANGQKHRHHNFFNITSWPNFGQCTSLELNSSIINNLVCDLSKKSITITL